MEQNLIYKPSRFKTAMKKWKNKPILEKCILVFFFIFFCLESFTSLYPFVWVINNSLKGAREFYESSALITKSWRFQNYFDVFSTNPDIGFRLNDVDYFGMLGNSIWITFLNIFVNVGSSSLVGYCLAKYRFPGSNLLYGIMIFTQTIPIIGTGAAAYKLLVSLNMINNPMLIWMSWCSGFDYAAFIMYGYFRGISSSYMEAARIDGASEWQIIGKIIIPLAFPCMFALAINNFVSMWNNYSVVQINLRDFPNLAYGLFIFDKSNMHTTTGRGMYYAALVWTAIPGVLLYSCFQDIILKNLTVGGIKG